MTDPAPHEAIAEIERRALAGRFWPKVDKRGPEECWPWTASRGGRGYASGGGYGTIYVNGKNRKATQVSWELHHGKPFPDGMNACHSCDNPICVNPHHLWPGTHSENLRDFVNKGLHPGTLKTHCQRGHSYEGRNLMIVRGKWRACRTCYAERARAYKARRKAKGALGSQP